MLKPLLIGLFLSLVAFQTSAAKSEQAASAQAVQTLEWTDLLPPEDLAKTYVEADQATFELIALDLPLDLLQAGLETNGQHWLACQQAKQDEWITSHDRLPGIRLTSGLSVPGGKT